MSVEFLNVILLVEDGGHVGPCLGVLLLAPHAAGVVPEVPLAAEVEGEVNDALLTVQILLLTQNKPRYIQGSHWSRASEC